MTVAELIAILQKLPADARVVVDPYEGAVHGVDIEIVREEDDGSVYLSGG